MPAGETSTGIIGAFDALKASLHPYLTCSIAQLEPDEIEIGTAAYLLHFGDSGPAPSIRKALHIPPGDLLGHFYCGATRGARGRMSSAKSGFGPNTTGSKHPAATKLKNQELIPAEQLYSLVWVNVYETDVPRELEKMLGNAYMAQYGRPPALYFPFGLYKHPWQRSP